MSNRRLLLGLVVLGALGAACSSSDDASSEDSDLTSLTARSRKLNFEGVVYVDDRAGDQIISAAAKVQTQTAFGALLNSKVAVQTRELHDIDPSTFVKRRVTVIDTTKPNDPGTPMTEVRYTYSDNAVVPVALASHSSLSIALLANGGKDHETDVTTDCTPNDADTKTDVKNGFLWYDFDPSKAHCRSVMSAEQKAIDTAEDTISDSLKDAVAKARIDRIYLPTTVSLERADTSTSATYPEYQKLWTGGVQDGALVIGFVAGRLSHVRTTASQDDGWSEWLTALDTVFKADPEFAFTKIDSGENLFDIRVNGNHYSGFTFQSIIDWTLKGSGWPQGMPPGDRDDIKLQIGKQLDSHWITFEKKVKVAIDGKAPRDFTIRLQTYFGADEDPTPHRYAMKNSDVVVYNGHSYIGYGPLDPNNFRPDSFPTSYQLFFFDSCVSYNYYEKDFFTLKPGGSKALDLITNGIEAPEYLSGMEDGKFIARLIDGTMPSYQDLLTAAKKTDSLRVVDGELDNTFRPSLTKIRVTPP